VDCLIKDENVHQLVLKYLNHNPAESKVTSVEEGLIKAVTYEMPMVGDLCKFRTAHDWVYGAVMGVSYSYENLDLSERLLDLMRQRIVPKQVTYKPMVSVPIGSTRPDTSIREYPEYGYPVVPITEDDIKIIYPGNGRLGKSGRYDINFDVERLRERSIGVFGKSGTGKSTLVQLLACEMIRNGETLLIFDEHTELAKTHQAVGMIKPGLQDIFPHCVRTVSFGKSIFNTPDGKQHQADVTMKIPISVITEEDILQISDALILTPTAPFVLSTISRLIKKEWAGEYGSLIEAILFMKHDHYVELTEGSAELPMTVNEHSLNAVRNRLSRIFLRDSDNLNDYYTRSKNPNEMKNSIGQILEWLKQGQSVIINSASDTYGFVLIINVIFRMIINEWQKNKPRPLTIFLEEAHRLIPPNNETLVGMVAREMRKYGATLCIIDQTPKKIDNVVVKQIGTYFIFPLDQSEASCGVMPENLPVGEVLSRLASVGEAYVHGYTFLLPTYMKIHDYYELANGIIKENQKLLGKVGAGQSGGPTLASFYSGNKPGL
jgi:energy-coupling factor transporter ATP-binding protein EcfA2